MSDLNLKELTKVKLLDGEHELLFDLNAIDDIQDHFDIEISKMDELFSNEKKSPKSIKYIATVLINEAIEYRNTGSPLVTEREIGRLISISNFAEVTQSIFAAFVLGMPEQNEEDTDPNSPSE